jgi:hypothetical protein
MVQIKLLKLPIGQRFKFFGESRVFVFNEVNERGDFIAQSITKRGQLGREKRKIFQRSKIILINENSRNSYPGMGAK